MLISELINWKHDVKDKETLPQKHGCRKKKIVVSKSAVRVPCLVTTGTIHSEVAHIWII